MFALIKELTELVGPIGQEQAVLDHVEALWRGEGLRVERTKIGNLYAHVGGNGPRVVMAAHADELAYLVRAIDDGGYLWLANGQAWTRTTGLRNSFTIGQRVRCWHATGSFLALLQRQRDIWPRWPCPN